MSYWSSDVGAEDRWCKSILQFSGWISGRVREDRGSSCCSQWTRQPLYMCHHLTLILTYAHSLAVKYFLFLIIIQCSITKHYYTIGWQWSFIFLLSSGGSWNEGEVCLSTPEGLPRWSTYATICYSYSSVLRIYGCNRLESEGVAWGGRGLFTNSHKSLATCAITILYPTWLFLCCYSKHICTCASVYSNFNIIYTVL